jgi:hypothetical protein
MRFLGCFERKKFALGKGLGIIGLQRVLEHSYKKNLSLRLSGLRSAFGRAVRAFDPAIFVG